MTKLGLDPTKGDLIMIKEISKSQKLAFLLPSKRFKSFSIFFKDRSNVCFATFFFLAMQREVSFLIFFYILHLTCSFLEAGNKSCGDGNHR